ncbi:MAG: hypothetical protein MUE74_12345 [Bacteroidales bacterium]|nr:hypothetical protein [Bacteroidales bacterium]
MKNLITSFLSVLLFLNAGAQNQGQAVLEDLEKKEPAGQEFRLTATITSATRIFSDKNDLTSVIMVIPKGSVVEVIGSDSTYFHVLFEDNDGYIYRRHAEIDKTADAPQTVIQKPEPAARQPKPQQQSRFSYLEGKYGTAMAAKMAAGKIWKGMNAEMIRDSWGSPQKVNRVISGNTVKEEMLYKSSWLYLENDRLIEWGPLK